MINRRHIRVKVMQSVYAMIKSHDDDIVKEEKFLKFSIKKMFDLYVLLFKLLVEVQNLAEQKQEISKQKHLVTDEDLSPNRKFVENKLIKKIAESSSLSLHIEAQNLNNWSTDDEYVKLIWEKLRNSTLYTNYLSLEVDSFTIDKNFVIDFFTDIIAPNTKLAEYFEDENITWVDDIPFVNTWVVRSLKNKKKQILFYWGIFTKIKMIQILYQNYLKKLF